MKKEKIVVDGFLMFQQKINEATLYELKFPEESSWQGFLCSTLFPSLYGKVKTLKKLDGKKVRLTIEAIE